MDFHYQFLLCFLTFHFEIILDLQNVTVIEIVQRISEYPVFSNVNILVTTVRLSNQEIVSDAVLICRPSHLNDDPNVFSIH